MVKLELMLFIVAASSLLAVDGCPFLVQPTSKNISQGSTATFTVTTCGESVLWARNQFVYSPGYDHSGMGACIMRNAEYGTRNMRGEPDLAIIMIIFLI
jgi:hypothetical protein